MKLLIPEGYAPKLSIRETERTIKLIKHKFEGYLADSLNLERISAPMFVRPETGLNDDLNGIERAVSFDIPDIDATVQIVQSLAKWKRHSLAKYHFSVGSGLYTDMNAIRRDEQLDNLHSVYVDQWDWEKVIDKSARNLSTLKQTVKQIVGAMCDTAEDIRRLYPSVSPALCREVFFITTQELEIMYPDLSPKQRENIITKEHRTVFLMKIGDVLESGQPHDGRAPDYDDWELNGDLLLWSDVLDMAVELSSMGIRVDAKSLARQLKIANCEQRLALQYHQDLMDGKLPLTIGGGIGQSRFCMLLLQKAHVGEVQVSEWPAEMVKACAQANIQLL